MTVYLDVLIAVNLIVNYYLLLITAKFGSCTYRNFRLLLSAFLGSLFSLYIFLPSYGTLADISVKLVCSIVMIYVGIGFVNIKNFLRNVAILFAVSFIYAGGMIAIWSLLRIDTIIINNSVVYLDISPIFLILFTVIFYFVIVILKSLLKRNSIAAMRCKVRLHFKGSSSEFIGIFDTGNSVVDIFGDSAVIFTDKKNALEFLGSEPKNFENCYRILPCKTVTGSKLLEAVRLDKAEIMVESSKITLHKPILAISESNLDSEYSLILNPEILRNMEEKYVKA